MKRILQSVILVSSLGVCAGSQAELATRYLLEMAELKATGYVAPLTPALRKELGQFNFVMIDGFLGDLTEGLFGAAATYLRSELAGSTVKIIRPPSFSSTEENANYLVQELNTFTRPTVIVAHSRGAADLFLGFLKNPALLRDDKIAQIIFVQGAFSGSPLAEWVAGFIEQGCGDSINTWKQQTCDFVLTHANSLTALLPDQARKLRMPLQNSLSQEDRELFNRKFYFVKSRSTLTTTHPSLLPSALFFKHYYSYFENDAVLLTVQQRVTGFGRDLGTLEGDHTSLLKDSRRRPHQSSAFIKALLLELTE